MSLAESFVEVKPDLTNFKSTLTRGLSDVNTSTAGEFAGKSFTESFGHGLGGLSTVATAAFGPGSEVQEAISKVAEGIEGVSAKSSEARQAVAVVGATAVGLGTLLQQSASKDVAAQKQLAAAIKATGGEWGPYREEVEKAITAGEKFGYTADETQNALSRLVSATNDPKKALEAMGLAEDYAAARHVDLVTAAAAIAKVYTGNTKVLRQFGIQTDSTKEATRALASAQSEQRAASEALHKAQSRLNDLHTLYAAKTHHSAAETIAMRKAVEKLHEAEAAVSGAKTEKDREAALRKVATAQQRINDLIATQKDKTKLTAAETIRLRDAQAKVKYEADRLAKANDSVAAAHERAEKAAASQEKGLETLTQRLDGQAKAQADTFQGRSDALRAYAEDLLSKVGAAYGPIITQVGAVASALAILDVALVRTAARWVATTVATIAGNVAFAVSNSTLGIHIGLLALDSVGWVRNTALRVAATIQVWAYIAAQKAAALATKAWAAVQWLLNAAMDANPIGIAIVAIAALTAGIIYAYKHSETFRKVVDAAWHGVATGATWLWERVLRPTFTFLVKAWLTVAGAIVHGAATAFGWVPGLGPKLKGAAAKFDTFAKDVNRSLDNLDDRSVTVSATFRASYGATAGGATLTASNFGKYHGLKDGGPVPALPGSVPHKDSVNALLVPGEFIVREDGSNLGDAVQHFAKYAAGGLVVNSRLPGRTSIHGTVENAYSSMLRAVAGPLANAMMRDLGGGVGGSGVQRWAPLVAQVLSMLHQSIAWLPTVLRRMNQESGGNPNAQNNWDINAMLGMPSQGLMQTIPPTFLAYAGPFRGLGIRNPLANIYAGLNYALHRYGSLAALSRPGGYDDGGMMYPGETGRNFGTRPERVLSASQTDAFDRLVAALESGAGLGGSPSTLVVVDADGALIGRMRVEAGSVLDDDLMHARWGDS